MAGKSAPPANELFGRRPSEKFERANRLTGISRNYRMPEEFAGLNYARIDRWLHEKLRDGTANAGANASDVTAIFNTIADRLVDLNPELTIVSRRRDSLESEYDLLAGAAAGYNPNDISYYIDYHRPGAKRGIDHAAQMAHFARTVTLDERMKAIAALLRARNGKFVEPVSGCQFSPATLDLIEQQARQPKPGPRAQQKPKIPKPPGA